MLAALMIVIAEYAFPGTVTEIGIPIRGGLVQVEDKRALQETQYVQFTVNPWAFFEKYPNDHAYVLLDASLPGGAPPYRGRGIILSKAANSIVVSFEDFNTGQLKQGFVVTPQKQDFEVIVHANRGWVAAWVRQGKDLGFACAEMADNNKEKVSLVIVGGTSDFSGPKNPTQITVKDFKFGRFVP